MRRAIIDNLKNVRGWRTTEKLVVLSFDDYGNVRLDSRVSRDRIEASGVRLSNRFDRFDALETAQDLEALYEVLTAVSDSLGNHAVVTPYTLCANVDIDAMREGSDSYRYLSLLKTFELAANAYPQSYSNAWSLWQEGIRSGLLRPQFHGREHLSIEVFDRLRNANNKLLGTVLRNRSVVALDNASAAEDIGFSHAFGYSADTDIRYHKTVLKEGLSLFAETFGFSSLSFAPPALRLHPTLYKFVEKHGVKGIDKPFREGGYPQGAKARTRYNYLGQRKGEGHVSIVRNVVFEPTNDASVDSVELAIRQIASAFRWHKPAIISSHRVNFAGHIEPSNRALGLESLRRLLTRITRLWPDVRFVGADDLVRLMWPS